MPKLLSALTVVAALAWLAPAAIAEPQADAASQNQQSVAAEAPAEAGGCAGGGSCCGSCEMKKKYAKKADDGLCPCQRARLEREAKAREAAAAKDTTANQP